MAQGVGRARAPGRLTLHRRALLVSALAAGAARAAEIATPLTIEPLPPGGQLRLLGGLQLNNGALGFGGLSALHLDPTLRLTAISDVGQWLTAQLVLRDGRPVALEGLRSGPLRDAAGEPLPSRRMADAEALARLPDGTFLVGFERWHRIRAYRDIAGPGLFVEPPPGIERSPGNEGLETLAVMADGTWLAISEGLLAEKHGQFRAWLGGPGRWRATAYRPEQGFRAVDAAPLPGGGALVLERGFTFLGGFEGRIARLPTAALARETLMGETLLTLGAPLPADNFEGISVVRSGGRTLLALLSDDNENLFQRSLLLLFELAE